jgi:hypothetical protein
MAFWSLLVQDGCDYAQLHGSDMVETVSGLSVYPFLELGRRGYRPPMYDTTQHAWVMVYTQQCTLYGNSSNINNNDASLVDTALKFSKWCTLLSFVFGGSVTLFLWCMTVLTYSIRTWRFCGIWMILALLFRCGSFFFFRTHMCTYPTSSSCQWFYGAQMDVAGILAMLIAIIAIFAYYPNPPGSKKSSNSARGDGLMRDGSDHDGSQGDGSQEFRPMTTTTTARKGSGRSVGVV